MMMGEGACNVNRRFEKCIQGISKRLLGEAQIQMEG
jgi:hypothetical protein